MPRLQQMADASGAVRPAFCPRIFLTDSRLDNGRRMTGEGTIDQIREDLEVDCQFFPNALSTEG